MKKLGKFLVVGAVAAVACAALVGCGAQTYSGEYKYANPWNASGDGYGVTVSVEVSDGKITKVTCTDPEGYHNITATWTEGANPGDLGHDKAAAGLDAYLNEHIIGKTVSEIKAINVGKAENGVPNTGTESGQGAYVYTGATQTSGRIILAIQAALKDVK